MDTALTLLLEVDVFSHRGISSPTAFCLRLDEQLDHIWEAPTNWVQIPRSTPSRTRTEPARVQRLAAPMSD